MSASRERALLGAVTLVLGAVIGFPGRPPDPQCVLASKHQKVARDLFAEGRLAKSLREIDKARDLCARVDDTWDIEVEARAEIGDCDTARHVAEEIFLEPAARDVARAKAHAAIKTCDDRLGTKLDKVELAKAGQDLLHRGDAVGARRLFDRVLFDALPRLTATDADLRPLPLLTKAVVAGDRLVACTVSQVIVIDLKTGNRRFVPMPFSPRCEISADAAYVLSSHTVIDVNDATTRFTMESPWEGVGFSSDGALVGVWHDETEHGHGEVRLIETRTGAIRKTYTLPESPIRVEMRGDAVNLELDRDDETIYLASIDALRKVVSPPLTLTPTSPDGRYRAYRSGSVITIEDVQAHKTVELETDGSHVTGMRFTTDSSVLKTYSRGSTRQWIATTGERVELPTGLAALGGPQSSVLAHTKDGSKVIVTETAITIEEPRTHFARRIVLGHDEVVSVALGSGVIAAGTQSGDIWRLASNDPAPLVVGHHDGLDLVAVMPDGKVIASARGKIIVGTTVIEGDGTTLFALRATADRIYGASQSTFFEWEPSGRLVRSVALAPSRTKARAPYVISPKGDRLIPQTGNLELWDTMTGKSALIATTLVQSSTFSYNGAFIVARGWRPVGAVLLDGSTGADLDTLGEANGFVQINGNKLFASWTFRGDAYDVGLSPLVTDPERNIIAGVRDRDLVVHHADKHLTIQFFSKGRALISDESEFEAIGALPLVCGSYDAEVCADRVLGKDLTKTVLGLRLSNSAH